MNPIATRLCTFLIALGLSAGVGLADVVEQAGTIEISFDIKPTSCPNPFNSDLSLDPVFPTAILGTDDFSATQIKLESLVIVVPGGGGFGEILIPPIGGGGFEDVATPVEDNSNCACTTDGADGFTDLTVHFDQTAVEAALGEVSNGQEIALCIRGELDDETPFEGCDCIFIVGPVPVEGDTWGRIKASYRE